MAQAAVADGQRLASELGQHRAYDAGAREDDLGAVRLEADDGAPLVGCAGAGSYTSGYAAPSTPAPSTSATSSPAASSPAADASAQTLGTADSSLGTIVVDGTGMTVYVFDHDTQGTTSSACTGGCAAAWPAVHGDATTTLDGVTGDLGSITGPDGQPQVTLNGWPLYYYAGDKAAGDVNGQASGGIWWVVGTDGVKITN